MVSPKNHRKISDFCELRRHRFCSIFRAKHNEWWLRLIWAIFRKTTNSLLRNKRKNFVDLIYGTLETAYHFHFLHLWIIGSVAFSLSFLLQLHFVWVQDPDSLLTTQGSAISSSPSSNIRTSGWSLHNQMTLAFRGAFIVPELLSDSRMICCHLTFLSAIDRHDMLHEALGCRASLLYLSLNCSFSDSFMSVFSGRSHHLLFPSRS